MAMWDPRAKQWYQQIGSQKYYYAGATDPRSAPQPKAGQSSKAWQYALGLSTTPTTETTSASGYMPAGFSVPEFDKITFGKTGNYGFEPLFMQTWQQMANLQQPTLPSTPATQALPTFSFEAAPTPEALTMEQILNQKIPKEVTSQLYESMASPIRRDIATASRGLAAQAGAAGRARGGGAQRLQTEQAQLGVQALGEAARQATLIPWQTAVQMAPEVHQQIWTQRLQQHQADYQTAMAEYQSKLAKTTDANEQKQWKFLMQQEQAKYMYQNVVDQLKMALQQLGIGLGRPVQGDTGKGTDWAAIGAGIASIATGMPWLAGG